MADIVDITVLRVSSAERAAIQSKMGLSGDAGDDQFSEMDGGGFQFKPKLGSALRWLLKAAAELVAAAP